MVRFARSGGEASPSEEIEMPEIREIVAAFADGERVNVDELERALAMPEGRDHLIDLLALREVTVGPATAGSTLVMPPKRPAWRYLRLAVAAAVVCVSTAAGYALGSRSARQAPGAVSVASSPQVADSIPANVAPPAPTRVIRLEPGVDWQERGGGN